MYQDMKDLLNSDIIETDFNSAIDLKDAEYHECIIFNLSKKIYGFEFFFFGSRFMKVATEDSDVDIFACYDNAYHDPLPPERANFFVRLLERKMRADWRWEVKQVVTEWHASFVRAYYKPHDVMVDVSFTSGLAVENTKLLNHMFTIQPDAAKFCLLMKRWLKMHQVDMKGYVLVLLVIFFLQRQKLLPTIQNVQRGVKKSLIEGYEVQFNPSRTRRFYKIRAMKFDDKDLIKDFFNFYRDFDFGAGIISLKFGCVLEFNQSWKIQNVNLAGPITTDRNALAQFGKMKLQAFKNHMENSYEALRNRPVTHYTGLAILC